MSAIHNHINNDYDEGDEDEWGTNELIIDRSDLTSKCLKGNEKDNDDVHNDDVYWNSDTQVEQEQDKKTKNAVNNETMLQVDDDDTINGEPMFILDVTKINPNIHSKYDRNSVNDPESSSKIRRTVEKEFEKYVENATLLANGTIIPCGTTVWKGALSRMRDERKGHYFLPIFPPKK